MSKSTRIGLILLVAATAQPCARAADYSSPQAAYRTYLQALHDGDLATLQASVVGTDAHQKLLAGQIAYGKIEQQFRAAAIKAYPDSAQELAQSDQAALQALEKAKVKTDGEHATLTTPQSIDPVRLTRADGAWKVDLGAMYDAETVANLIEFRSALSAVLEQMIPEIQAGKFKSYGDLKSSLEMRVKMHLALPKDERATAPSTRPSSQPATQP